MQICVHTPVGYFESKSFTVLNSEETEELHNLCEKVTSGDATKFKLETKQGMVFFGSDLMKNSVITLKE